MKVLAIVAAVVFVSLPASAEEAIDAEKMIRAYCAAKWAADYEMQKYCIDEQIEAAAKVYDHQEKYAPESEERKIMDRCVGKWTRAGVIDFEMVAYCIDEQMKAYRALYPPKP